MYITYITYIHTYIHEAGEAKTGKLSSGLFRIHEVQKQTSSAFIHLLVPKNEPVERFRSSLKQENAKVALHDLFRNNDSSVFERGVLP